VSEADDQVAERRLTDRDEMLFRQVIPEWVEDGVPSSQAFAPTGKDEGCLSIARGSATLAQAAYEHHTTALGLRSAGTWGITVGEALDVGLASFDDPQPDVPAHGFVDFRGLGRSTVQKKAKLLRARAHTRGRLYP
jgi:hypothetical protein